MSYLLTFGPWIVYALISGDSPSSKLWGALGGVVVSVVVLAAALRRGSRADALIIEIGSGVFFAALAVVAFVFPGSALLDYATALSSAALAVIAWVSLAIRRPFTLGIAKRSTPSTVWDRPLFRRTNVIITTVWATSFTLSALALAVVVREGSGAPARAVAQTIAFAIPMVFTIRYATAVRARAARATD
ncbi:MAG: hypothetical protein WBL53_03415 [Pseudonocardiaceae bacterium]